MIKYTQGNILEADVEAVINTVNIVGVMGKGIALQFKEFYPENYKLYKKACDNGALKMGKMFVTETNKLTNPKYIINFPTKNHWRSFSKIEYISDGLDDLKKVIKEKDIKSVAIPPLGAGSGGLSWSQVESIIISSLSNLDIDVLIYEPAIYNARSLLKKKEPKLTSARAFILSLLKQYTELGFQPSLVEVQKLAYFSQRFGENLNLHFSQNLYGPYAHNLTFLLENLDGYYIEGMKAKKAKAFDTVDLVEENYSKVEIYIDKILDKKQRERLISLKEFIHGFESPLGMELLATVDFIYSRYPDTKENFSLLVSKIYSWSERKRRLMKKEYIKVASDHLKSFKNELINND